MSATACLLAGLLLASPAAVKPPAKVAAKKPDPNLFHSVTAGFRIVKPAGWHFLTAEKVAENRAVARLKDEEMEKQIRERASAPLVAFARHEEPYDDLNPSVQVIFRPMGDLAGTAPVELLETVLLPPLQKAMADFELVGDVKAVEVGGQKAAAARAKYTVKNPEGRSFPTLARLWIVPRGKLMFLVGMSGPQEGADVSEEEFARALASIVIDD